MINYRSDEVFGVTTEILNPSYVNRGGLDARIQTLLSRNTHIALRGESKCGKSWLRQRNIPDAITIQCRLRKSVKDLYTDALSQLGLNLVTEKSSERGFRGTLQATQEIGVKLLAKLALTQSLEGSLKSNEKSIPVGRDLDDLRFVSDIINTSGRRLVIEDFHYLSSSEREAFAFDLKALWDYKTFVTIIGIWAENNHLLHLNPDLSGRVEEISIYWSDEDLKLVLDKGASCLNVVFSPKICARLIEDSFGTVGIVQKLALDLLDTSNINKTSLKTMTVDDTNIYDGVAMHYADQLNALYQTFATRVSGGIRQRKNSTGIYAHMLKVVMDADSKSLTDGLSTDAIFRAANSREPRIQKPNLRQVLSKIDEIQVDKEGRGLILTYDEGKDEVFVIDKQLFLYRKYATAQWPWERLIAEAGADSLGFQAED